uniref:A disintegrin and metalloproteinase with thrombospondin motifs 6-like n=1 Tax=Crassostrea virginica TaxID=6565 RepID=A0A8B8D416_CRAVI
MAVLDIRLVVCLQVMNFWVNGLQLPLPFQFDGVPVGKEVKITVRDDGSRIRRSFDGITKPARKLEVSFPVARTHVTLQLSRNDDVLPEVPVYTTNEDGVIVEEDIKDDHKAFYYQDITSGATVFVQTTQSSYCLFGSFFMDSEEFFLEPSQRECTDSLVNSTFRIWKADFSHLQYSDVRDGKLFQDEIVPGKHQRRSKRSVSEMKIETLFIIDYSIYSYWNSTVIVDNETDRARTTRSVIRQFYAFVINGMDVRYKSIPPYHDFTLSVVFAGIYIADTESKSPFTEEHKVVSLTTTTVDADDVLNHTTQWLQQTNGLPGFDHAMMFSRFDFTSNSSSAVSGLAWLGTMCKQDSVSIVEDHFNFVLMTVAAHELGHSLNAEHDGSNNECKSTSSYIMAPYVGVEKGLTNPWVFSNCSIQYFADLIEDLDQTTNCLITLASDHNPTALIPEINTLPGSVYDVNEHCRHIVGQNSQFCRAPYEGNFTDICTILYCFDNDGQNCNSYLGGDGIPCGDKKWCLSGVCTQSDLAAPAGNEECLFGDDPAFEFTSSNSIYSCNGSDNSQPIRYVDCYDEIVRKRYCETCSSFYIGITGCEYGDKNEQCGSQHCNTDALTCCQTCSHSTDSTTEGKTTTNVLSSSSSSSLSSESTTLIPSTVQSETTTEQMTTLIPSGTTSIDSTQSSSTITTTSTTETTAASTESMETSSSPSTSTTTTTTEIPTTTTMLNTTPSEAAITESTTIVPTTEGTSIRSTTTTTQSTTPPPTTTQTTTPPPTTTQTTTPPPTTTQTTTPPPTTTQTTTPPPTT